MKLLPHQRKIVNKFLNWFYGYDLEERQKEHAILLQEIKQWEQELKEAKTFSCKFHLMESIHVNKQIMRIDNIL